MNKILVVKLIMRKMQLYSLKLGLSMLFYKNMQWSLSLTS